MRDTLEDLYYGDLRPNERQIAPDSPLSRALERAARYEEELTALLEGDARNLLLNFINAQDEVCGAMVLENFILGFRLGMRLAVEGLLDSGDSSMTRIPPEGDDSTEQKI